MLQTSGAAVEDAARVLSLRLEWDALIDGAVPAGSYREVVLPDGLPRSTRIETLSQISEALTSDGVLRVELAPDLGVLTEVTRRLGEVGFQSCEVQRGSALFAPTWSALHIAEATNVIGASSTVVLFSESPIRPEILVGYQASFGSDVRVVIAEEALTADLEDARALVVTGDIVPEPRWIRTLMEEHARTGRAVGCALADTNGRRLHVGADGFGQPWAAGSDSHHPLLNVRREAELLAPFVASAADLSSGLPIRGTLFSAVCAISTTEVLEVRSSEPTRQVIGSTTLVVAEESEVWLLLDRKDDLMFEPGAWIREQQVAGSLIVISVPEFFDPWLSAELARQGVVLNDESCASSVGELGQLLQPDRVAFASNYRLEDDYALLTRVAQQAEITWIGSELCARPERLDSVGSRPRGEASFISDIPSLEPVDIVVGLTSIVIPVYGMWQLTKRCIELIQENTPEAHEIIVVDDCSPDETLDELVKLDLITVANEENLGFPGAVNAGLRRARGEFVCVLNNDTEVTPNWLGEMLGVLDRERVGMVGPRSNCITGRQAVPKTPQMNEAARAHRWAQLWSAERAGVSWPTNTLIGFCLLSRRDLYEQLGAFEEGYGHGNFEDLDMSLRIRDAGHTLRVADGSVVLHHGSATFATSGIDLEALMHQTYQRFGERDIHAGGLLTALVLSDGDGDVARASAASAVAIADETIVLERGCLFDAELLTAAGGLVGVRSISLDWADGEQLSTFVSSLESEWIVVLGAGEDLVVNECGRARSELDGRSGSSAAVRTSGGSQIRVHSPVPEAIEAIGLEAQNPLQRILIRQAL